MIDWRARFADGVTYLEVALARAKRRDFSGARHAMRYAENVLEDLYRAGAKDVARRFLRRFARTARVVEERGARALVGRDLLKPVDL